MKQHKLLLILLFFIFLNSCSSQDKKQVAGRTAFQIKMNRKFKDASTTPLTKRALKKFKGLDFFPVDEKFKVIGKFIKTSNEPAKSLPTTTDRVVVYRKYGELHFTIDNNSLKLNVYKDEFPLKGFEQHLFLPFLDKTNGTYSYSGGRFLDIQTSDIANDGSITINFNNAYNPYCAYNTNYSCPITPRENYLDIEIKAGVMIYKK